MPHLSVLTAPVFIIKEHNHLTCPHQVEWLNTGGGCTPLSSTSFFSRATLMFYLCSNQHCRHNQTASFLCWLFFLRKTKKWFLSLPCEQQQIREFFEQEFVCGCDYPTRQFGQSMFHQQPGLGESGQNRQTSQRTGVKQIEKKSERLFSRVTFSFPPAAISILNFRISAWPLFTFPEHQYFW